MNPILKWRKSLKMSQRVFARHLSTLRGATVTQAQVSGWENGAGMSRATRVMLNRFSGGLVPLETTTTDRKAG
jgi:DNA-binding transcriptional regulator YiaG